MFYLQIALTVFFTLTITVYKYSLSVSIQKAREYSEFTIKYSNEIAAVITGGISATLILILSTVRREMEGDSERERERVRGR